MLLFVRMKKSAIIGLILVVLVILILVITVPSRAACIADSMNERDAQLDALTSKDISAEALPTGLTIADPKTTIVKNYSENIEHCVLRGNQRLQIVSNRSFDKTSWKTHTDERYSFSIMVPEKWFTHETESGLQVDTDTQQSDSDSEYFAPFKVEVIKLNDANQEVLGWLHLNEFYENYHQPVTLNTSKVKDIKITNADEIVAFVAGELESKKWHNYYVRRGNVMYKFSLTNLGWNLNDSDAMLKSIVSTFELK